MKAFVLIICLLAYPSKSYLQTLNTDTLPALPADSAVKKPSKIAVTDSLSKISPANDPLPEQASALHRKNPETGVGHPYDKIVKTNGDTLTVTITNTAADKIHYIFPMNYLDNILSMNLIREIYFRDGSVKHYQYGYEKEQDKEKPVASEEPSENNWRDVIVTTREKDVEGMTDLGDIDAKAEADRFGTSTQLLEKNATLTLRKKAAHMGGTKVLIINKNYQQSFGDLPYVELQGKAYGK